MNKTRGKLLALSAAGLLAALLLPVQVAALTLMGVCFLGALIILYHHMEELTDLSRGSPKMLTLRAITIFDFVVVALCILVVVLLQTGRLERTEHGEEMFTILLVLVLLVVLGNLAPKIPLNRHTGLRLPWTVGDEETWIVAHRILGYLSLPLSLLYLAGVALSLDVGWLTLGVLLLWVGVPGVFSYLFFRKKWMV